MFVPNGFGVAKTAGGAASGVLRAQVSPIVGMTIALTVSCMARGAEEAIAMKKWLNVLVVLTLASTPVFATPGGDTSADSTWCAGRYGLARGTNFAPCPGELRLAELQSGDSAAAASDAGASSGGPGAGAAAGSPAGAAGSSGTGTAAGSSAGAASSSGTGTAGCK